MASPERPHYNQTPILQPDSQDFDTPAPSLTPVSHPQPQPAVIDYDPADGTEYVNTPSTLEPVPLDSGPGDTPAGTEQLPETDPTPGFMSTEDLAGKVAGLDGLDDRGSDGAV